MTPPRPPRTIARAALQVVAACALTVALILLIAPIWLTRIRLFWPLWVVPFMVFRLYIPLGLAWILRRCLSATGNIESGAARISAWTGICVIAAGLLWMSDSEDISLGFMRLGRRDIPWFYLLMASESARLAVMRGSMNPRVVAIGAFGLAIGSSLALGSDVMDFDRPKSLLMGAFGSVYTCVAVRPWIAVICLAGLWLWVGLADRRRAVPTSVPE